MTTTRRYSFQAEGAWDRPGTHSMARSILERAERDCWWYEDGEVQGEAFNRLNITFTVHGRDRWWCHRRAMKLAVDCWYAMGFIEKDVPTPSWESLAPHTNRGRHRVS